MNYFLRLLIVIFLFSAPAVKSQNMTFEQPAQLAEQIYIHHNSSVLFPGEKLYYALYNLNQSSGKKSTLSKIAKVSLLNSDMEMVFSHTLDLSTGVSYSDFLIPSSLATGNYKLVGYTNWMSNYDNPAVFIADVFIINPYLEKGRSGMTANIDSGTTENSRISKDTGNQRLKMELKKDRFKKRENVMVTILSAKPLKDADLSVSVRKIDTSFSGATLSAVNIGKLQPGNFSFKNYPEYRGQNIKGQLLDSNNLPYRKVVDLQFAVANKPGKFRVFTTDTNGRLDVQTSDKVDFDLAYISAMDEAINGISFQQDSILVAMNVDFATKTSTSLKNFNLEGLREKMIHHQIDQYYNEVKLDSVLRFAEDPIFYGNRGTKYILDEYTRFSTMQETFVEIIEFVSFSSRKNTHTIKVSSLQEGSAQGGIPLVIVDGLPVTDHNSIYSLDPNTVEAITVLKDKYYYGSAFYQGILNIETKGKNFLNLNPGSKVKMAKIENEKLYHFPHYTSNKKNALSRVPDYRYQLYWNPGLNVDEFNFFTSDIAGNFEIRIEGFYKDGEPITVSKMISVED